MSGKISDYVPIKGNTGKQLLKQMANITPRTYILLNENFSTIGKQNQVNNNFKCDKSIKSQIMKKVFEDSSNQKLPSFRAKIRSKQSQFYLISGEAKDKNQQQKFRSITEQHQNLNDQQQENDLISEECDSENNYNSTIDKQFKKPEQLVLKNYLLEKKTQKIRRRSFYEFSREQFERNAQQMIDLTNIGQNNSFILKNEDINLVNQGRIQKGNIFSESGHSRSFISLDNKKALNSTFNLKQNRNFIENNCQTNWVSKRFTDISPLNINRSDYITGKEKISKHINNRSISNKSESHQKFLKNHYEGMMISQNKQMKFNRDALQQDLQQGHIQTKQNCKQQSPEFIKFQELQQQLKEELIKARQEQIQKNSLFRLNVRLQSLKRIGVHGKQNAQKVMPNMKASCLGNTKSEIIDNHKKFQEQKKIIFEDSFLNGKLKDVPSILNEKERKRMEIILENINYNNSSKNSRSNSVNNKNLIQKQK